MLYLFRKTLLALLTLLIIASASIVARADTINFDDTTGAIAGNRYQSQGVLLSAETGTALSIFATPFANTSPNAICGLGIGSTTIGACSGQVIVDFVLPGTTTPGVVSNVSFFGIDRFGRDNLFTASVFDANGGLLKTGMFDGSSQVSFSVVGIRRLVFTPSGDTNGQLFDTLSFGSITAVAPSAVPEPTTVTLLITGLAGGGAAVRKRRKTAKGEAA